MTTLDIVVMADPRRRDAAVKIAEAVGAAQIVWDRERGLWDTAKRAWLAIAPEATHHMVIQDDVIPCVNFRRHATEALEVMSHAPIAFCTFKQKCMEEALSTGSHWIESRQLNGQAVVCPAGLIPGWLDWEAENVKPEFKHDDARLSLWSMVHDVPVFLTAPCLVEHDVGQESLLGHGRIAMRDGSLRDRVASALPTPEQAAGSFDWTAGSTNPVRDRWASVNSYKRVMLKDGLY